MFGNGGPNEPLPNDRMDNTEICNLLQTIEENTMVLYVWQFEQSRGQLRDLFGGATNVEIIFNKDMKIIVAEPGHTARGFFNAKTVKKNDPPATYKLTSFVSTYYIIMFTICSYQKVINVAYKNFR